MEDLQIFANNIFGNPYIMAIAKVTVILYASQLAPKLPTDAYRIFDNIFVKIAAVFMIIVSAERQDYQMALVIAIAYVFSLNAISGRKLMETFADFPFEGKAGTQKLIEPKSILYPGCEKTTVADLELAFAGDVGRLQSTVRYAYGELLKKMADTPVKDRIMRLARASGLPMNVQLNEENAPLISTILMYYGNVITPTCAPPSDDKLQF